MINTYNESDLHNTIKSMYIKTYGGNTEVETDQYICDVVTGCGDIYEIQTANLSKLFPKIQTLLKSHKVTLVYPLAEERYIELSDENGGRISKRRSPKRLNIYSIFDELTGLYPLLLNPGFTLEVLSVSIIEHRIRTAEPVQLANKSRRFRKNWIKTGKELNELKGRRTFSKKEDYLSLLPDILPASFTVKELAEAGAGKYAAIMLWVLRKMNLVSVTGKKGNAYLYEKR